MIRFFTPAAFLLSGTLLGVAPLPLWARSKARPREPTSVLVVRVEDGTGCKLDQAAQVLLEQSLARQPALSPARAPAAAAVPPTPEATPAAAAGAVARLQPARPAVDAGAAAQGLLLRVVACQDRLGTGPEGRPHRVAFARIAVSMAVVLLPRRQLTMSTSAEAEVGVEVGASGRLTDRELGALRRDALEQAVERAVRSYVESLAPPPRQRRRGRPSLRTRPPGARTRPAARKPRPHAQGPGGK